MNRDDILRMAREADLCDANGEDDDSVNIAGQLVRFAALVTAAKDAEHQQTLALQQRSYEREIQLEVEAEREAYAKVCEGRTGGAVRADQWWNGFKKAMRQCASAIRARSKG